MKLTIGMPKTIKKDLTVLALDDSEAKGHA